MADKQQSSDLSLIGAGTVVEGKVKAEGSVRIDGKLVGDVISKGNAAVGLNGILEGTLNARNVTVAGKVTGTLVATEKLVLEGKSSMKGDIRAARLIVDEGALFDGHCVMSSPTAPGKAGA
jgi:cytoskeletal protein CcmA (bactofilin family)